MSKICLCLCLVYFFGSVFLTGCGSALETNSSIGSNLPLFRESASSLFIPESDQVNSNCHAEGEACIYLKNPVFHSGTVVSSNDEATLKKQQTFSVKLTGIDKSGFLKNSHFDFMSFDGQRMPLSQVIESKGLGSRESLFVNSYYWLNRAHEYLLKNFETYPSHNRNIKIYVDDAFDGWMWSKESLHLNANKKSALSADVMLALYGEMQAAYASEGAILNHSSANHKECGGDLVGCCETNKGCSQAIVHGVGDYFVSMLFEDAPGVGEFYSQKLAGQTVCGKSRNPTEFNSTTLTQAFSLCSSQTGNTLSMGLVYASIWQKIRTQFDKKTIDALFLKHLKTLKGTDTFETALTSIKQLCNQQNLPQVGIAFQSEFTTRGL